MPDFLGLPHALDPGVQTPLSHPAVLAACCGVFLKDRRVWHQSVAFRSLLLNQLIVFLLQVASVPVPTALTAAIGSPLHTLSKTSSFGMGRGMVS